MRFPGALGWTLASVLAGCGSDAARLEVTPSELNLGAVELLAPPKVSWLHLTAHSDEPIVLQAIELESDGTLAWGESPPSSVAPGETVHVPVEATAQRAGPISASIPIDAAEAGRFDIPVRGEAGTMGAEVIPQGLTCGMPGSLSLGGAEPGAPAFGSVVVRSTGSLPMGIEASLEGDMAFSFVGNPLSRSVEPGETVEIPISMAPTDPGNLGGELVLRTTSKLTPEIRVPICGFGRVRKLCVRPERLDLGTVPVSSSTVATISLVSCGSEPVEVRSIERVSVPGFPSSPGFIVSAAQLPRTLAPNDAVTLSVEYTAPSSSPAEAAYRVQSDAVIPAGFSVLANARDCRLELDPATPSFRKFSEEHQTLTITNRGRDDCRILATYIDPPTSFALIRAPLLPTIIRGHGGSVAVEVAYFPGAPGSGLVQSNLTVELQGAVPTRFTLSGDPEPPNGCRLSMNPSRLDFGLTRPTPVTFPVYLNNVGDAVCSVPSVRLSAGSDRRFAVDAATPIVIPAGGMGQFLVTASPARSGSGTGEIEVRSNDTISPTRNVPVRVSGQECEAPCTCSGGTTPAYWRFDPFGAPSAIERPQGAETSLSSSCEVSPCASGFVQVETQRGHLDCLPNPPPCPSGLEPELRPVENSFGWICTPCDVVVHFGALYDNLRVCAPTPDVSCSSSQAPTFSAESFTWQCVDTCNNGAYDQRYIDGNLVCVPC